METELKTAIALFVLILVCAIIATLIDLAFKAFFKYLKAKHPSDNSFTFPSSQQFYDLRKNAIDEHYRNIRIKYCQAKYNHKTASNSRKIRGAGK